MRNSKRLPDGRPTTAEWPVRIWTENEIPAPYGEPVRSRIGNAFSEYHMVYAPKRRTDEKSFAYLFGYGKDEIFYFRETEKGLCCTSLLRKEIVKVRTRRELLNAAIILEYMPETGTEEPKTLEFPYVPSVYYLYDPFLNWTLGISRDFVPAAAEQEHPRPERLYRESCAMYNYSLAAYRLGDGFSDYQYESRTYRHRWMPWKTELEEWLKVSMARGVFALHSRGYLTECSYRIAGGQDEARTR